MVRASDLQSKSPVASCSHTFYREEEEGGGGGPLRGSSSPLMRFELAGVKLN